MSTAPAAHRRLLPAALAAMGVLLAVKLVALGPASPGTGAGDADGAPGLVGSARASQPTDGSGAPPRTERAAPAAAAGHAPPALGSGPAQCGPDAQGATPEQRTERELLQALRARRAELDAKEQALITREVVAEATERRAARRLEELSELQRQAAVAAAGAGERERAERVRAERERAEREDAAWRQTVRLYEGMRPRDAAAILDDLELSVLVPLVHRLREAKAAPILGAMRPDRARALTAELARPRARGS